MTAAEISTKLELVRKRIARAAARAGREVSEITLIAVTKTQPVETIREAITAGLTILGENRVQEWGAKRGEFPNGTVRCHLIGRLQSNKARKAAAIFDRVDSLDGVPLAQRLDAAAGEESKRLGVLIEVHLSGEESKSGVSEAGLDSLTNAVRGFTNLKLEGLMTVPPYFDDVEKVRPYFRRLRELREDLRARTGLPLPVLSMGMSHDFEVAIEEGATEVRIGSALFGERAKQA